MSVLVYTENWDGKFKKLSFELVSYASKVAEMLGTSVTVVSIGNVEDAELGKLGNYGASKILKVEDEKLNILDNQVYSNILAQAVKAEDAKVIVIANNNAGKAIAPHISSDIKHGIFLFTISIPSAS